MALPKIGDGEQIGDGNVNETLNVGRPTQPVSLGGASGSIGFFGVTATTRPASASQAALTLTTATAGGYGFTTSTAFSAAMAQLENIRASLVTLGLLKGSA